VFAPDVHFLVH